MNIANWRHNRTHRNNADPSLYVDSQASTYEQLARKAWGVAKVLTSRYCLQPGDRVGLYVHSPIDYAVCSLATLLARATIIHVNEKRHPRELGQILHDARATLVIADVEVAVLGAGKDVCVPVPLATLMPVAGVDINGHL